jgi:hypothetical protein
MRFFRVIAVGFALGAGAGAAQAQDATAPPSGSTQTCVDVRIGNDRSAYINCLNQRLQQDVQEQHPAATPTAPITAQSSSTQVGTFNENAAREKMGNAFGRSATPQRPHEVFVNPLIPNAH